MIVVALIIVVVCAVVILGVLLGDASDFVELSFFNTFTTDVTSVGAFLVGLATGAVTLLGLWLLLAAVRRARHKAVERREMERRHEELEREKAELEHKLGRDRPTEVAHSEPPSPDPHRLATQPEDPALRTRHDPDPR